MNPLDSHCINSIFKEWKILTSISVVSAIERIRMIKEDMNEDPQNYSVANCTGNDFILECIALIRILLGCDSFAGLRLCAYTLKHTMKML